MNKENIFISKLNKESIEQFNKCIYILDDDNDKETKYIFEIHENLNNFQQNSTM
jgi:hypothetical protein